MITRKCLITFVHLLTILVFSFGTQNHLAASQSQPVEQIPNGSISFTENKGQLCNELGEPLNNVFYYAEIKDVRIYVTEYGLSYFFLRATDPADGDPAHPRSQKILWERIDMEIENMQIIESSILAEDLEGEYRNYYLPQCPTGVLGVRSYKKLTLQNIYPGIDWVITAKSDDENGMFKQDFIVHPGADVQTIRLHYSGPGDMRSTMENGSLNVKSTLGELHEDGLIGINGNKNIPIHYSSTGNNSYRFIPEVDYDKTKDLVVDPNVLVWGTYYGGSLLDSGNSICSDGVSVWTAGTTTSTNLPCLNPGGGAYYQGTLSAAQDVMILKFDAITSARLGATYYGGTGIDSTGAIHFDGTSVFVTGSTSSTNFPTQNPGGGAYYQAVKSTAEDMFLLKFNAIGVRLWATFYGGNGSDMGTSLFSNGTSLFVCGYSQSTNFPVQVLAGAYNQAGQAGVQNAVILKFTVAGVRNWSSYYGGDDTDVAHSLTVNGINLYMAGQTNSSNFPVQNPAGGAFFQGAQVDGPECFIARFNTSGVRSWSTYYGGNDDEGFNAVHCDGTSVWVTGYAVSDDFPLFNPGGGAFFDGTQGADQSGTILKFSLTGVRQWATYYGGNVNTEGYGIFSSGTSVWITGRTESDDFPTQDPGNGAFFQAHNSDLPNIISESWDMFILEFNPAGIRQWATYYGKEEDDRGTSVWFDGTYLFFTGTAVSGDLYLVDPGAGAYFQGTCGGCGLYNDAIILKFGVAIFTPVELTAFNAISEEQDILLEWKTASELNNEYFEVQHSVDGIEWISIGEVSGFGTSQVTHLYSLTDHDPSNGINYYRLEQFDYNGESHFSDVVSAWFNSSEIFIYPNPGHGQITISGIDNEPMSMRLFDNSGRLIVKIELTAEESRQLDLSFLQAGVYNLLLENKNFSDHMVLIIQ